jgi:type VI secretion system protein ImpL
MRATWFIAATVLAVLWIPVAVLPIPSWGYLFPILFSIATIVALVLYERRSSAGHSESRRRSLEKALSERLKALGGAQQLNINTMREDMRDGVAKLTGALPGSAARHAIEALPWYLVIGAPQSGKSSFLAATGQQFGYTTPATGAQGGRGCRFWLAQNAAFIDTSGEYMTGEASYAEWLAFLQELDRTRPGVPLHGIVVTLAADSVMQTRNEDMDAFGRRLRDRLDEALNYLGIDVPVYLVVTRCDALPGFMEYFADQKGAERGQILGFTMPVRNLINDPVQRATQFFDALADDLQRRMYRRVLARGHVEVRSAAFMFPQWFTGLRTGVLTVAQRIFASNTYMDQIAARGVYFTSSSDVMTVVGDAPYASTPANERGMFTRDLFRTIMLPDRELARPSPSELKRRMHRTWAITAPLVGGTLVLSLLSWHSYGENLQTLTDFRAAMNDCAASPAPIALPKLDLLRARVERIRVFEVDGAPSDMRMGFYVGEQIKTRAATVYASLIFREVGKAAVDSTFAELSSMAATYSAPTSHLSSDEQIRMLDTQRFYLMLTTPRSAGDPPLIDVDQRAWFKHRMADMWQLRQPTHTQIERSAREAMIELYALVLADDQRLGSPRDLGLVTRSRMILSRLGSTLSDVTVAHTATKQRSSPARKHRRSYHHQHRR